MLILQVRSLNAARINWKMGDRPAKLCVTGSSGMGIAERSVLSLYKRWWHRVR